MLKMRTLMQIILERHRICGSTFRYREICRLSFTIKKNLHSSPPIKEKHNPVLGKLLTEFTNVSYIKNTVDKEELKDIDYNEWKDRIMLLKEYGFEDLDCFQMISLYPSLIKIPLSNLKSTVQQWLNAELGTRNFQLILITHPHLLEVDDSEIRKRLPILRTYFRGVSALSQMIINCPNVMYEDWNELYSKINYLITERKFKMGDLLKSCALSKDLAFMKLRFHVCEKCGVYKQEYLMPHEENKHKKSKHENPKLKYILQDNEENFARLVAKITFEEYLAAKDLFNFENENDDEISDDDSDDGKEIKSH